MVSTNNKSAKSGQKGHAATSWVVTISLFLIVLLILAIVYQLLFPVKVLDAIEKFTQSSSSNLIYVYMDGCGHCQRFDPIWEDFNKTYRNALRQSGVSTEKLRNDDRAATAYSEHGFPNVVLVSRSGDFSQTTFEGQRTVQGLAAFVAGTISTFTP